MNDTFSHRNYSIVEEILGKFVQQGHQVLELLIGILKNFMEPLALVEISPSSEPS